MTCKLKNYRETANPASPIITFLSPSNTEHAYFVEHGFVPAARPNVKVPDSKTVWTAAARCQADGSNAAGSDMGQWCRACCSSARFRSPTTICSPSGRWLKTRQPIPWRCFPTPACSARARRRLMATSASLKACWVCRRQADRSCTIPMWPRKAARSKRIARRLAGLYRQVLGHIADP